jgi:hypothetical protein
MRSGFRRQCRTKRIPNRRLTAERLEDRSLLALLFEVGPSAPVHVLIPSQEDYDDLGFDWTGVSEPFDDSNWAPVSGTPNGVGFDRGSGAYDSAIGLDVESSMYEQSTTLFARTTFDVADANAVGILTLRLRYDDGFIAWLNGVEVARANAAGAYPTWNATATTEYEAPLAPTTFDVSEGASLLRNGTNVLAIRVLNDGLTGDDALLQFTLTGETREGPPLAVNDAAATPENAPVTINVLANDRPGTSAIAPASVTIVTPPMHGSVSVNANGAVTYTPNGLHNGPDTFSYYVRDNTGSSVVTTPVLLSSSAPVRAWVPSHDLFGTNWRGGAEPFNDSAWSAGTFGVGYDRNTAGANFIPLIGLNVGDVMQDVNTSIYARSYFNVANPDDVRELTLRMRFDDGFAAFINGVEVARRFAPATLTYNSATNAPGSEGANGDDNALIFQPFDLTPHLGALRTGQNVLAIQGLNQTVSSSDMLIQPELTATVQQLGSKSNIATVTVDVTPVDYPPVAVNDHYQIAEGNTLVADKTGPRTARELLVPEGAMWRYSDLGTLPTNDAAGRNWKQLNYSDDVWREGPAELGYGNAGNVTIVNCGPTSPVCDGDKYMTTWFRHEFLVTPGTAAEATRLLVELVRDDGASVYLNGVEIMRENLPGTLGDDTILPTTGALLSMDLDNETRFFPKLVDLLSPAYRGLLRDGKNVLAVEVHQFVAVSSDVSFNLRLSVDRVRLAGVLGNDVEEDGEPITASLVEPPHHGALVLNSSGTFSYTPEFGFVGADSFTYEASDGKSISPPATVTIEVLHAGPTALDDDYEIDEGGVLVVSTQAGVLANDTDTQSHPLSATVVSAPAGGMLTFNSDGSFEYAPQPGFSGVDWFTYRASDGQQASATAVVTITVADEPVAPVAASDDYALPVGVLQHVIAAPGVLANDSDGDGDPLTAELVAAAMHGSISLSASGAFVYTRAPTFSGVDRFTYRAWDGTAFSAPAEVRMHVPNSPPAAQADAYSTSEDTQLVVPAASGVLANDTDPESQPLSASLMTAPLRGSLSLAADGSFVYTPDANYFGPDSFSYRATDGAAMSGVVTVSLTVASVNDIPISSADAYSVLEGQTLTVNPLPTGNSTGGNRFIWSQADGGNGHVYEYVLQRLSWSDAALAAQQTIYEGAHGHLATITSQVEHDFIASRISGRQLWIGAYQSQAASDYAEPAGGWRWVTNEPWQFTRWHPANPDNDDEGAPENYLETYSEGGALYWNDMAHEDSNDPHGYLIEYPIDAPLEQANLVAPGANWRYLDDGSDQAAAWREPAFDDTSWPSGPAQFGYGEGDEATVIGFGDDSTNKHITTYFRHAFFVDDPARFTTLMASARRDDGIVLYLNGVQVARELLPADFDFRTLATDAPDDGQNWVAYGGIDAGLLRRGMNILAVEIHQVSRPSSDVSFDLRLDGARRSWKPILANDSDLETSALQAIISSPPENGSLQLNTNGSFTYQPNPGFVGVDSFTYSAGDGTEFSPPNEVTITVRHARPTGMADAYATDEDAPLVVGIDAGVLANDRDAQNHALSARLVGAPQHGTIALAAHGGFTYTPNQDYHGQDYFEYRAADATGQSEVVRVAIDVRPAPDAPQAVDDRYRVEQDTALVATAAGAADPRSATIANFDAPGTPYTATAYATQPAPREQVVNGGSGRALVITHAVAGQANFAAFDRTAQGAHGTIVADFDFRIQPNTPQGADGLGFMLLNTEEYGLTGTTNLFNAEEPNLTASLGVGFDIFSNVGEGGNHVSVHYDGAERGRFDISESTLDLDDGRFYHAQLRFDFSPEGAAVSAVLTPAGGTPFVVADRHAVPGVVAYEARPMFGGRTGASYATQTIDNVYVQYLDPVPGGASEPRTLVPKGATWRYLDNGTNQGSAWRGVDFVDFAWRLGVAQFGYGDNDEQTVVAYGPDANNRYATTYFRHTFTINDLSDWDDADMLRLELKRDDGAAVYLNGVEIVRSNLAADAIYSDFAESVAADDGQGFVRFYDIDPGLLVAGKNVLAVEVHQASGTSSDLSFDARLSAMTESIVGVLANDRDVDGDLLTASVVAGPLHGTLQFDGLGKFVYTPQIGFVGVDRFTYRVSDGQFTSAPATVTIIVSPPGGRPEDLNSDGSVDLRDLALLVANFGKPSAATLAEGDLDGDGRIGIQDVMTLRSAIETSSPAAPSPAAASMVRAANRGAIEPQSDFADLRATRRYRQAPTVNSSAVYQAVDRVLAASNDIADLSARRSRSVARARR